jgi:hypothetical protein
MRADREWLPIKLARELGQPVTHIRHVLAEMLLRGDIVRSDDGRGLVGLRGHVFTNKKLVSTRILEELLAAPNYEMRWVAMHRAIGQQLASSIDTLEKIGVLEPPDRKRHGGRQTRWLKLAPAWVPRLKAREVIHAGNGLVLWQPAQQ